MRASEFVKTESYSPANKKEKALIKALLSLRSEKDMAHFLRDIMTPAEMKEIANRLEMARLLMQGHSYESIAKQAGVSTTTVTRVAHWLFRGTGGYQKVLKKG